MGLPSLPGLPVGTRISKNLPLGKKTHGAACCQHLAPIKVSARHHMHAAFGIALLSRCCANGICRFLHQQSLITVQGIKTSQAFLQMCLKLRQGQLHKEGGPVRWL